MYDYRLMTPEERKEIVEYRRLRHHPWHAPSHGEMGFSHQFFISAACYEHASIIGKNPARMTQCEEQLLTALREYSLKIYAWCVVPNHYHVLVKTEQIKELCHGLGLFHGRSSFGWNGEDDKRGRQVWYRCFDREIRSERHFWASMNYIHHNPVHHG
jgi:putative transposase